MSGTTTYSDSQGNPVTLEQCRERIRSKEFLDSAAGQLLYDTFRSLDKKMWNDGKEATRDFALEYFPDRKTVHMDYNNRQCRRVLEWDNGEHIIIIYDYMKQTTTSALMVKSLTNDRYLVGKKNIKTENLDLYY